MSPDQIESVLARFRVWFQEEFAAPDDLLPPNDAVEFDGSMLVEAFTALRHEVHLQTRAVRSQVEQLAPLLERLGQPLAANRADAGASTDADARPFLDPLMDAHETLRRVAGEIQRLRSSLDEPPERAVAPAVPFWKTLLGLGYRTPASRESPKAASPMAATSLGPRLEATLAGLTLALDRLGRATRSLGLEAFETLGQPFEPEIMEAIEAVDAPPESAGRVVEELRRGFRWKGRLLRPAQVRIGR